MIPLWGDREDTSLRAPVTHDQSMIWKWNLDMIANLKFSLHILEKHGSTSIGNPIALVRDIVSPGEEKNSLFKCRSI